jgi:predicted component of type VI protein secretion system
MKLLIEDDEGEKSVVPLSSDEIAIGRQQGNTVCLSQRNVSRRHARLVVVNGGVYLEDLGSSNGTRVNGERIEGRRKIRIGDLIQIGNYDLAIQESAEEPEQSSDRPPPLAASPPPAAARTGPAAAPQVPAPTPAPVEAARAEPARAEAGHPSAPSPSRAQPRSESTDERTAVMAPQRLAELNAQVEPQAPQKPLPSETRSQQAAPRRLIRPLTIVLLFLVSALLGFAAGQIQIWMRHRVADARPAAGAQAQVAGSSAADGSQSPDSDGKEGGANRKGP